MKKARAHKNAGTALQSPVCLLSKGISCIAKFLVRKLIINPYTGFSLPLEVMLLGQMRCSVASAPVIIWSILKTLMFQSLSWGCNLFILQLPFPLWSMVWSWQVLRSTKLTCHPCFKFSRMVCLCLICGIAAFSWKASLDSKSEPNLPLMCC